jgi:hypothetical protein
LFVQRLQWDTFSNQHDLRKDFQRHIRMTLDSFDKSLELEISSYMSVPMMV